VTADAVLARELKSLQDEFSTSYRERLSPPAVGASVIGRGRAMHPSLSVVLNKRSIDVSGKVRRCRPADEA